MKYKTVYKTIKSSFTRITYSLYITQYWNVILKKKSAGHAL